MFSLKGSFRATLSLFIVAGVFLVGPVSVSAATAGANSGSSFTSVDNLGGVTWSNPSNAQSSNDSRATSPLTTGNRGSDFLQASGFGFSIPLGSTITGIQVAVERSASNSNVLRTETVQMIKAGTRVGTAFDGSGDPYNWGTTDVTENFGSVSDLWGTTWSVSDVNNAGFGVAFVARHSSSGASADARVDHVTITVTYTLPGSTTAVSCTSNPVTYGGSTTCTTTVTGSGGNTPTGSVTVGTSGSGTFTGGTTCALVFVSAGTASCSKTYTPSSVGSGTHTITATYAGDTNFQGSNGNTALTVSRRPVVVSGSRAFDGTATAAFGILSITNVVGADVVSLNGGSATLASSAVGVRAVTTNTLTLTGAASANYTATGATGNVTINLANQTISVGTAAPVSAVYGDSFSVAATASSALTVAVTTTGSCTNVGNLVTMTSGTGSCVVHYNQAGNTTYNAAPEVTNTVTALKKTASVTANASSKVFGTVDPVFTGSLLGFLVGDGVSASYSRTAGESVAGSPYIISAVLTPVPVLANYDITYNTANFDITKANQTITFGALGGKTYGDADFSVSATSDSALAVTFSTVSTACSVTSGGLVSILAAGSCTITASQVGDSNYNAATPVGQTFAIAKADALISVTPYTVTYDAAPHTAAGIATGVNAEDLSGLLDLSGTVHTAAGTYAADAWTFAGNTNYNTANGTVSDSIGKADAVCTITGFTGTYDGSAHSATGSCTGDGVLTLGASFTDAPGGTANWTYTEGANFNGQTGTAAIVINKAVSVTAITCPVSEVYTGSPIETCSAAVTGAGGLALNPAPTYTANTNVGTANAAYTFVGDTNHTGSNDNKNFAITAKPITVTVTAAQTKVFGDADPVFTYTPSEAVTFSGVLDRVAGEDVGTYAIGQGTLSAGANYSITFVPANFSITLKPIAVTADTQTKVYGASDPSLTYQFTPALVAGDSFTGALSRVAGESVGVHAITQGDLALSGNYALSYTGADLTITPAALLVTADAQTKPYGASLPSFTVSYSGLVNGDTSPATPAIATTAATAASPAGTYSITASGAVDTNYAISYAPGTLTVTGVPLTITASSDTMVYGGTLPTITPGYTGLVNGDTAPATTPACSTTATVISSIGSYLSSCSGAIDTNYTISYVDGTVSVSSRDIQVTADAQTKVYGQADPALTYSVTSGTLQNGDTFTGALNRAVGENVGPYAISQNTLTLGGNYALSFVGANLAITSKPITVTPTPAQSKVFGEANPVYAYSNDALVSGDAFTGALSRASGESVGAYAYTIGSLDAGTNYSVTLAPATFEITQATSAVTVDCPSTTQTYTGAAIEPCSATYITSDNSAPVTIPVTYTNNTMVGTANASATYAGDANHSGNTGSANFTIGKADTVTAVTCPAGSYTYSGIAQTPCSVSVTGPGLSFTPTASYSNNINAGLATASYAYAGDANYNSSSDSDTFTIAKADALISVTPYTVTYDAAPHTAAGIATGVNAEDLSGLLDLSGTVHTAAGTYAADAWTFAGNTNYNTANGTVSDSIGKADAVCTITGFTGTYDGSAHSATGSCTGDGVLTLGASFTDAPGGTANWTYTEGANFNGQTGTAAIVIDQAPSVTTVTCSASETFTGSPITPCSVSVNGAGGLSLTPAPLYANSVNVGTANAAYIFAGDLNHTGSTDNKDFEITKAASATVISCPVSEVFTGSALTPCTANVTGAGALLTTTPVTYGANTAVGTATADAVYVGDANHNGSTATQATFQITAATASVTISNISQTYDASEKPVTVTTVPDGLSYTLTYAGGAAVPSEAGNYAVVATITDTNYAGSDSKILVISKATVPVTALNKTITVGDAEPTFDFAYGAFQGTDATSTIDIAPVCSVAGAHTAVGTYTINCASGSDDNYDFSYTAGTLTVNDLPAPVISAQAASAPTDTTITVTWTTDHPATSRVVLDTVSHPVAGSAPNYGYASSTPEFGTLTTNHSVVVYGLTSGTTYYFRGVSHGSPETASEEVTNTTTTPAPTTGTITVTKVVVGTDAFDASDFPLFLNDMSITSGVATTTVAGAYTVRESSNIDFLPAFSGVCVADPANAATLAAIEDWRVKKLALMDAIAASPEDTVGNETMYANIQDINAKIEALLNSLSATITLGAGDAVSCTLTNTYAPIATSTEPTTIKVHIIKYLDGATSTAETAAGYQFPMTATWNAANIGAGTGTYVLGNSHGGAAELYGADTSAMSTPADYTTSEITSDIDDTSTVLAHDAACVEGKYRIVGYSAGNTLEEAAGNTPTNPAPAFTGLSADKYIIVWNETCGVTPPVQTGGLVVVKHTFGGNGVFSFTGDLGPFAITTHNGSGSKSFSGLTLGAYTVSETVPSGWTQTGNTCVGATVSANSTTTCTITNTKNGPTTGKLKVIKRTIGGNGRFSFEGDAGTFSIRTVHHRGSKTVRNLEPGTYTVTEAPKAGWTMTGNTCDDVVVTAGHTSTCTITNTKGSVHDDEHDGDEHHDGDDHDHDGDDHHDDDDNDDPSTETKGSIVIEKVTVPSGSETSFDFSASYDENGFSLADGDSNTVEDLNPGTYSVSEEEMEGWSSNGGVCVSTKGHTETAGSISLQAGETVTCTFTNTAVTEEPTDVCPNIDGNQSVVPEGKHLDEGQCVNDIVVVDVCPNIGGAQETVPSGMHLTEGQCVNDSIPVSDACPNIAGVQDEVPSGKHISDGQCVDDVVTTTVSTSGGGGGGGNGPIAGSFGGGGGGGGFAFGGGSVLGASTTGAAVLPELPSSCKALLTTYMRKGKTNDSADVKRLQKFLNDTLHTNLPISGYFGSMTDAAVRKFQVTHPDQVLTPWGLNAPTGYVFKTTQRWINLLSCSTLNIPMPQL